MEVRRIEPSDEESLAEYASVLRASDKDLWPDLTGFTLADIRAFAQFRSASKRFDLLAAGETAGPTLGVGMMELPLRDNVHGAEITVAVHPAQRRRGVGTAIVESMSALARADGRHVLNSIVDVPLDRAADHASLSFAPKVGFEATLAGNTRHLALPLDDTRLDELRGGGRTRARRRGVPRLHLRGAVARGVPRGPVRALPVHVDRRTPRRRRP